MGEDEGDAAWIVAVLCGLWYKSVKTNAGRERTCPLSFWVRLGIKSWDTSQLGREGGEKAYLYRVSVSLQHFLEWEQGEKKRPSGSSARCCHLSAWSTQGVNSFSGGGGSLVAVFIRTREWERVR